jgi:hypothetical protein
VKVRSLSICRVPRSAPGGLSGSNTGTLKIDFRDFRTLARSPGSRPHHTGLSGALCLIEFIAPNRNRGKRDRDHKSQSPRDAPENASLLPRVLNADGADSRGEGTSKRQNGRVYHGGEFYCAPSIILIGRTRLGTICGDNGGAAISRLNSNPSELSDTIQETPPGQSGGIGRRRRLKISRRSPGVWVRPPPLALIPRLARSERQRSASVFSAVGAFAPRPESHPLLLTEIQRVGDTLNVRSDCSQSGTVVSANVMTSCV